MQYLTDGEGGVWLDVLVDRESSYFDADRGIHRQVLSIDLPRGPGGLAVIQPGKDRVLVAPQYGVEPVEHRVMKVLQHTPYETTVEVHR